MKCPNCKADNAETQDFCGGCGAKMVSAGAATTKSLETAKEELTTGSVFAGRYKIVEELGEGGMGKVYKAIDRHLNEEVAIKLIKPEIAADKKTIQRFGNELKLSRKIGQRNVGRMYELMQEGGTYFITMEYVSGQDLKGLIRQTGQLAVGTTISIAKQVCEGLIEAHRLGVIHRDLKPNNIMIDKGGNDKIMDFGIARSLSGKSLTKAGAMIGTPEYMSPEQVEGEEVDKRSDIYSLGVILYEMVTGRLPFEGETALSVAMKHKREIPKDPKDYNPQLPDDLNSMILKCLEKEKECRYQGVGDLHSKMIKIEKEIPNADRVVPRKKLTTSKEITVTFNIIKVFIPALFIAAVVISGLIIWRLTSTREPSIAILPFEDFSQQKDQEYLCDSFTDEIITKLINIESLIVRPRTSSFSFKGKGLDSQEIGKKLEVEHVLEGTLQKTGNKLRITIQLVKVVDGHSLWSEKYERDAEDIFTLQDEITLAIVDKLKVSLLGEERARIVKHHTESPEAWDLYSWGRHYWNKRTKEGFNTAITFFDLAIKEDPSYAKAFVGLADCYNLLGAYAYLEPKEAYPKAKEAAKKALSFDNTLAEAHTSLAYVLFEYEWDWEGSEREFKQAIELNPNYATAHHWYSALLSRTGRTDEAVAEIKRAQKLDPQSLIINCEVGYMLLYARLYDQAIDACQEVLKMDEGFWRAHYDLARIYLQKEMYEEALEELQKAKALYEGWEPGIETLIGVAYVHMGKREEAGRVLDHLLKLSNQKYVPAITFSRIYFALEENDEGFIWLEKSYEERSPWIQGLKIDPLYDSVRSDPRFKAMLKKMGLDK